MTSMTDMNWAVIYPEALLLLLACVVAIADLFVSDSRRRPTFWMTQASIAAVAAMHLAFYEGGFTLYGMQGMVVTDPMGHLLAFFACIAMMATVAYAQPHIAGSAHVGHDDNIIGRIAQVQAQGLSHVSVL